MLSSIQNVVSSLPDGWNKQGEKSLLSNISEKKLFGGVFRNLSNMQKHFGKQLTPKNCKLFS